jgi:hypothetical protein
MFERGAISRIYPFLSGRPALIVSRFAACVLINAQTGHVGTGIRPVINRTVRVVGGAHAVEIDNPSRLLLRDATTNLRADGECVPRMCCPAYSNSVSWKKVKFGQTFYCESCQKPLRVPESYNLGLAGGALLTVALGAYFGGARGTLWLLWVVGAFFPFQILVLWLARKMIPPNLELSEKQLFEFGGRRPR